MQKPALPNRKLLIVKAILPVVLAIGMVAHVLAGSEGKVFRTNHPESYISEPRGKDGLDSVALWQGGESRNWVIAAAGATHRLLVYDAGTGRFLRKIGRRGTGPAEFRHPSGLAVLDDLLFVVERDNRRFQVLELPGFTPVGMSGDEHLLNPAGIAVHRGGQGSIEIYVADSSDLQEGKSRVARFLMRTRRGTAFIAYADALYGEGPGTLGTVESVAVDPVHGMIVVADEHENERNVKVFSLEGRFLCFMAENDRFVFEPAGVALFACGSRGAWIAAEQHPVRTRFHLFDRASLDYLGWFSGQRTSNADSLAASPDPFSGFDAGGVFAVDDDQAVSSFDWSDVTKRLRISVCDEAEEQEIRANRSR